MQGPAIRVIEPPELAVLVYLQKRRFAFAGQKRVPPASLPKLAFELLREKFSGQLGAVGAFRDWCRTHGVQHEFDSWS
jgi:hypothetical protein